MPTATDCQREIRRCRGGGLAASLALLLVLVAAPAGAGTNPLNTAEGQNVLGRGFDPTKVYQFSEIDAVNTFNGKLTLHIPLGPSYPQDGGGSFGLTLVYDSNHWDFKSWPANEMFWLPGQTPPTNETCQQYTQAWPSFASNAGLGWRLSLGQLFAPAFVSGQEVDGVPLNSGEFLNHLAWRYDAPDGSSHEFFDDLPFPGGPAAGAGGFPKFSRDGSYLRLDCTTDLESCTVESPGGGETVFNRDPSFPGGNAYRVSHLEDAFGNGVDVGTAGCGSGRTCWDITQHVVAPDGSSHPRHITVQFAPPQLLFQQVEGLYPFGHLFLEKITLPAPAGSGGQRTQEIDFEYFDGPGETPVLSSPGGPRDNYPYGQTGQRPDPVPLALGLLKAISLPDGSRYELEYVRDGGQFELAYARLPTGGWVQWDWTTIEFPLPGLCPDIVPAPPRCDLGMSARFSRAVAVRRFYDPFIVANPGAPVPDNLLQGEWNYYYRLDGEVLQECLLGNQVKEAQTEVVDPHGHRTVNYYSAFTNNNVQDPPPPGEGWQRAEYGLPFTRKQRLSQTPEGLEQFLSREVYDCTPTSGAPDRGETRPAYCKLVRRDYTNQWLVFGGAADCSLFNSEPECRSLNPVVQASRREEWNLGTMVSADGERFTQWDDLGHFRHAKTSGDFCPTGSNNPRTPYCAGDVIESHTGYDSPIPGNQDPWLLGLFSEKWAKEGNRTEKETFQFDYENGFLWQHRRYADTAGTPGPTPRDVVTDFVPQVVGGRVTGNVAEERVTGGDAVPAGSATPEYLTTHTYAFGVRATSQARQPADGAVVLSLADRTIDPDTGVVTREVDPAGVKMDFRYDGAGRLIEIDPDGTTEESTKITYCVALTSCASGDSDAARVNVKVGPAGAQQIEHRVAFDGFGRVWRDRRLMPGGHFSQRETQHYADGALKRELTKPCPSCEEVTTYYPAYDAFGRRRRINLPGHTEEDEHQIRYHWTGTKEVEITLSQVARDRGDLVLMAGRRYEHFDRLGRMWELEEFSGGPFANEANLRETLYLHDLAGRLTAVKMFDGPDATCDVACQERAFRYDGRGFLRAERHPEMSGDLSFEGGTWDEVYAAQDSRGNPLRRQDGRVDLANEYDAAGRLIRVVDQLAGLPLQELFYARKNRNAAGDWDDEGDDRVRGRLFQTKQWHYLPLATPGPVQHVAVTESLRYRGLNGRFSEYTVRTFSDDGVESPAFPALRFKEGVEYDALGQVSRVDYPLCEGTGACPPEPARSVAYAYTDGWLTRVNEVDGADYASEITYHDTGLPASILHGNGVEVFQDFDPRSGTRPGRISVVGLTPSSDDWDSGPYSYDDAGNIYRIGAGGAGEGDEFLYDDVDRLVEARVRSLGGLKVQRYVFDVYGNLRGLQDDDDLSPGNGSPGESVEWYPTDRATNRLANAVYDASGDVTQEWLINLGAVGWDPLGRLLSATGTGANRRHLYTASGERIATFDLQAGSCAPGDVCASEIWTVRGLGSKVLREYRRYSGTAGWTSRDYVYRNGSLLASETPEGRRYSHLDHLGSPRLITAASGGGAIKVAEHYYFPFGREATPRLQDDERLKFTGHERDFYREGLGPGEPDSEQDDLDYMHARYYTPWIGRFLSFDPVVQNREDSQGWNHYAYARNNPIIMIDPNGQDNRHFVVGTYGRVEATSPITGGYSVTAGTVTDTRGNVGWFLTGSRTYGLSLGASLGLLGGLLEGGIAGMQGKSRSGGGGIYSDWQGSASENGATVTGGWGPGGGVSYSPEEYTLVFFLAGPDKPVTPSLNDSIEQVLGGGNGPSIVTFDQITVTGTLPQGDLVDVPDDLVPPPQPEEMQRKEPDLLYQENP